MSPGSGSSSDGARGSGGRHELPGLAFLEVVPLARSVLGVILVIGVCFIFYLCIGLLIK